MKLTLELDLDDNFEQEHAELLLKAKDYYFFLKDIEEFLRDQVKYQNDPSFKCSKLQEKFYEYAEDRELSLNVLS